MRTYKTQRQLEIDKLLIKANQLNRTYWLNRKELIQIWKRINRLARREFDFWYQKMDPTQPSLYVRLTMKRMAKCLS